MEDIGAIEHFIKYDLGKIIIRNCFFRLIREVGMLALYIGFYLLVLFLYGETPVNFLVVFVRVGRNIFLVNMLVLFERVTEVLWVFYARLYWWCFLANYIQVWCQKFLQVLYMFCLWQTGEYIIMVFVPLSDAVGAYLLITNFFIHIYNNFF